MFNLENELNEHNKTMASLSALFDDIYAASDCMIRALQGSNKILLCGNGGSAADAQHIAAEIIGRFETERHALPAIALTTDTSILTAVGNDYGYESIFSRQIEGLAHEGDVLLAYSTSGNSQNVVRAAKSAKDRGCSVIALTGMGGGQLAKLADVTLAVPSSRTARIQEAHAFIGHVLCSAIDTNFLSK